MLYSFLGNKTESSKKKLTFTMKPNELEDLANFGDTLHGKFKVLISELNLNKGDKRVKEVSDGFIDLCKKLNSMAKKST